MGLGITNQTSNTVIDDTFLIQRKIGQGAMASVYEAHTDLNKFNYSELYAYTQVQGDTHKERLEKTKDMCKKMSEMRLDLGTIKQILELQNIPMPGKVVALKWSKAHANLERFEAEWHSLICLNHKHIIKVYGGGEFRKRPFYIMELLPKIIKPKDILFNFNLKEKIEVVHHACRGVRCLHENGIIHRDLKPQNLLTSMTGDNRYITKVSDLGLALTEQTKDIAERIVGSPNYMAPEQVHMKTETNERSDVYGLGACLYYFITGHHPFSHLKSEKEVIFACASNSSPVKVQSLVKGIPKYLAEIVACAMNKNPSKRYQTVRELQKDLEIFASEFKDSLIATQTFSNYTPTTSPKTKTLRFYYQRYKKMTTLYQRPSIPEDQNIDLKSPKLSSNKSSRRLKSVSRHSRRLRRR